MRRAGIIAIAYVAIGIVAFGHSASGDSHKCKGGITNVDCAALDGLMAGLTWPLYFSWVAADAIRAQEAKE